MHSQHQKKNIPMRFLEFAAQPVTKADLASEAADFAAACERAERKGDRAHALLNSPECRPNPAVVREWAKDFEVSEGHKLTKGKP